LKVSNNIYQNYTQSVSRDDTSSSNKKDTKKSSEKSKSTTQLTTEQKLLVGKLESRDAHVRAHEAAHQSAGAATGAVNFTYEKGPNGKMYAIGGDVSISYQTGSTPQETIKNAQTVINAALAPSDPSPQDFAVASSAKVMMMKAERELAKDNMKKIIGKDEYKNQSNKNHDNLKSKSIDIST